MHWTKVAFGPDCRGEDHGPVMKWTKETPPVGQSEHESELSAYQRAMRNRLLAAPVVPAPEPWRPVFEYEYGVPVGGLLGIGFATDPGTGHDLVMVVSSDGHGAATSLCGPALRTTVTPMAETCPSSGRGAEGGGVERHRCVDRRRGA